MAVLFSAVSVSWGAAPATTLAITAPTANLRVSNAVFTVTGKATSSAGVSNVLYNLNNTGWANADMVNGWSNWSAQVTLTPGTNVVSAYAVSSNNVVSKTSTVKFIYVVMGVLTVRTNGNGGISPAYNGKSLQIGVNYSMTATPNKSAPKGYGLVSWTDGNSNVVSRSAKLTFMMASNLMLTANFGDAVKPIVKVISAATNSDGTPNSLIIKGTATDNIAVTNVYYQIGSTNSPVNPNDWIPITDTTNNWTNWTVTVTGLQPGQSVFSVYAVDSSGNPSMIIPVTIYNNTSPKSLSGLVAVTDADSSGLPAFSLCFSKSTFSQLSPDTNNFNAVGSYTYVAYDGYGTLKVKYTAPEIAAKYGSLTFYLEFLTPSTAIATDTNGSFYLYFSSATTRAISSVANQTVYTVGDQATNGVGTVFSQKGQYASTPLFGSGTNAGKYTYSAYSPVGGLFKLTGTGGTKYIVANFESTNYGSYYSENYDTSDGTNTDTGHFVIGSQKPGGNAPAAIAGQSFQIFSGGDSFNVVLGTDTYSQDTLSTNFDNDVGNYTYTQSSTNTGQLGLTVAAPPTDATGSNVLAGTTNAARLIFLASDAGMFTNEDGTLSSFVMAAATNFAPAVLTNATLNLTNSPSDYVNQIQFTNDGSFYFNGVVSGTYTYATYSPAGALVQIDFTNAPVLNDWLQLNFKGTNSGTFFVNEYDADTNFQDSVSGSFGLQ